MTHGGLAAKLAAIPGEPQDAGLPGEDAGTRDNVLCPLTAGKCGKAGRYMKTSRDLLWRAFPDRIVFAVALFCVHVQDTEHDTDTKQSFTKHGDTRR